MAGVYTCFGIRCENEGAAEKAKAIADRVIRESGYQIQGIPVWEETELSGETLSSETYCGAEYEDCERSRVLFTKICKALILESPEASFMGKHSFDYSNTDTADYVICFYRDQKLLIYRGEIVEDVGCMNAGYTSFNFAAGALSEAETCEYSNLFFGAEDDSDNVFMNVLESYDCEEYPEF